MERYVVNENYHAAEIDEISVNIGQKVEVYIKILYLLLLKICFRL